MTKSFNQQYQIDLKNNIRQNIFLNYLQTDMKTANTYKWLKVD